MAYPLLSIEPSAMPNEGLTQYISAMVIQL